MGKRFVRDFLKRHWLSYLVGIFFMLASTRIRLLYPEYVGDATDYLASQGFNWQGLSPYIYMLILVALVAFAGAFVWRNLIIGNARKLERELRLLVFTNFQGLSQSFYNKQKTGDLIAYGINDVNAVRMTFGPALVMSINGFAMVAISIYGIWSRLGTLTTAKILAPLPIIIFLMLKLGPAIRKRFRRMQEGFANISDRVNENISGIRVIKAYVQEEAEIEKFDALAEEMSNRAISMSRVSGLLNPTVQMGFAVIFGLYFLICGPMAAAGEITIGDFAAVANYLNMMLMPVMFIGRIINVLQRGMASMERLNEVLDYPHEIVDGTGQAKTIEKGTLEVKDLTFRYPESDQPVLKEINITLPQGHSLGILGETGSGKTTLVNLLLKIYNVPRGKIFLDGQDINDFTLKDLRAVMGYVPQDNFLFHDTVSENIRFFDDGYSQEEVQRAARDAMIAQSIEELPQGYDTILGERGVNLSGGQKQRISIARALIRDPAILILDDALSAVDTITESAILKRFREIRRDKTTLIIAHRVSAVLTCDEIIVLDDHGIAERGSHEELLKKGGLYYDIYRSQYQDRIDED